MHVHEPKKRCLRDIPLTFRRLNDMTQVGDNDTANAAKAAF